jgi:hypothetical protein
VAALKVVKDLVALVVLEERGLHEALSDAGSEWKEGPANMVLVCFFVCHKYIILSTKQKRTHAGVDFVYENKEEARSNTGNLNPRPRQCYSACWRWRGALNKANAGRLW